MPPHLTKKRYVAGVQCIRRAWLQAHRPDLAATRGAGLVARLEEGDEVGLAARKLFPGGVLVDEAHHRHEAGVGRTLELMRASDAPALFEAFLEHDAVRVRVDVLERLPAGGWGIREVKSGMRVRPDHLADAAVQRVVAEGMGIDVRSVEVVHVDPSFVRGVGPVDWHRFFLRADVTTATADMAADVRARLAALRTALDAADAPAIAPSPHCWSPVDCEFWSHCTAGMPPDAVLHLPRISAELFAELSNAGVACIGDIADGAPLTPLQARVRTVVRTGRPLIEPGLHAALAALRPDVDHLDFETLGPVVPLYAGVRPYQPVPCQWSLHRVRGGHPVTHHEFLASLAEDPRPAFAQSLLAMLAGESAPVVVWGRFEADVLTALADALPEHAEALQAIRARLVDLCTVVREHLYHAAFAGSFSLKRVAPALVPGFTWRTGAPVALGDEAGVALLRLATGRTRDDHEAVMLRRALLDYCACDTRATLAVQEALEGLTGRTGAAPPHTSPTPIVGARR